MHLPAASSVIVPPSAPPAVHTSGVVVVNVTGNPLEAVAVAVTGLSASVVLPMVGNVMVWVTFLTVKLRLTALADRYTESPGCSARTVHLPAASSVIVPPSVPPAVHTSGVVVVNVTGNPLEAVAVAVTGLSASVVVPMAGNVIVLARLVTVKLRLTALADRYTESPGCSARTVHLPAASSVIVPPSVPPAVHTSGVVVVNVTGRPDDAVALTSTGDSVISLPVSAGNVIVWATVRTVDVPQHRHTRVPTCRRRPDRPAPCTFRDRSG